MVCKQSPTLRSLKDTFKCVRVVLSNAKPGRTDRKWALRLSCLPPSIMLSRTATSAGDIRGWWLASGNMKDKLRDRCMESRHNNYSITYRHLECMFLCNIPWQFNCVGSQCWEKFSLCCFINIIFMLAWAGSENRGISATEMEVTVGQSVLCNVGICGCPCPWCQATCSFSLLAVFQFSVHIHVQCKQWLNEHID